MRQIISFAVAVMLGLSSSVSIAADDKNAKETKKVCVDQKDKDGNVIKNKDGSAKQTCKEVTVHKKLEGKEVPNQKK